MSTPAVWQVMPAITTRRTSEKSKTLLSKAMSMQKQAPLLIKDVPPEALWDIYAEVK